MSTRAAGDQQGTVARLFCKHRHCIGFVRSTALYTNHSLVVILVTCDRLFVCPLESYVIDYILLSKAGREAVNCKLCRKLLQTDVNCMLLLCLMML